MENDTISHKQSRSFAIICVLGPPGAGKGTLCAHLAHTWNLAHYSVGDGLRDWIQIHDAAPLANEIQHKLDNQGFLSFNDLQPFVSQAVKDALSQNDRKMKGLLIDGFPRCIEQLESFDAWHFRYESIAEQNCFDELKSTVDLVLLLNVTRKIAESRYVNRGRDNNDKQEKFDRRFNEYETETKIVEDVYRLRDIVINIDMNGTKEEVVDELSKKLDENELWQKVVIEGCTNMRCLSAKIVGE